MPFRCNESDCSFESAVHSHLLLHTALEHLLQRTFRCLLCPISFPSEASAMEHIFKEHIMDQIQMPPPPVSDGNVSEAYEKIPPIMTEPEACNVNHYTKITSPVHVVKKSFVQVDQDFLPSLVEGKKLRDCRGMSEISTDFYPNVLQSDRVTFSKCDDGQFCCKLCGVIVGKTGSKLKIHAKKAHMTVLVKPNPPSTRKWICR